MPDFILDASMSLAFARGIVTLLIGWLLGWLLTRLLLTRIRPFLVKRFDRHQQILTEQLIFWLLLILFVVNAFNPAGFELNVLLGAAGILSVAVGFTSQIFAANIISGLFVAGERRISFDDINKVGEYTGEILSVDWLLINFRTFDRLFVRMPNESFIKSVAANLCKFHIRRVDRQVPIAYSKDIGCTRRVLLQTAAANPQYLENPKLLTLMQGLGESSIEMQFSVWAQRENCVNRRNGSQEPIKNAFDAADIQLPFSHQTLLFRDRTPPLPIHITTPSSSNTSPST